MSDRPVPPPLSIEDVLRITADRKSKLKRYEVTFRAKNEFEFTNKWSAIYKAMTFGQAAVLAAKDQGDDEIWRIELYD